MTSKKNDTGRIRPFVYQDAVTGQRIEVRVSQLFTTLHIDKRVYFFVRKTGQFDGAAWLPEEVSDRKGMEVW